MMKPEKNYGSHRSAADILPEENYGNDGKFWEKPENVLRLIDLIFFFQEDKDNITS